MSAYNTSTTTSTISLDLEKKINEITADLQSWYANKLFSISPKQAMIVVAYIKAMKLEANLSTQYRKDLILLLSKFSAYMGNKDFRNITRDDVLSFLESYRKPENVDPLHKWIGTYNLYSLHLMRFFKWLYYPDIAPEKRFKPAVIDNIPRLRRKETSIYKPSDLWTQQDDLLFLKYCPSKREKCYHAISRDLSCRPHEILRLKIKDLAFKSTGNNGQYVELVVNGKTGTRPIPLIDSIPYLKDYLDHEHPMPSNPNAPLICGIERRSLGRGSRHLSSRAINKIYNDYKKQFFPQLLKSPAVTPEDKTLIKELLKKPWNPYIRRHSALTEKSMILKEHVLRQHAGWTPGSQMHLKYLHYFGNESSESLLEAYGLVDKGVQEDQLRPKQCPNCSEPNKPDSKFCSKCRMVLTYDAYSETLEKEDRLTRIENQMKALISTLGNIKDQSQVNQMAQTLYDSNILKDVSHSQK